MTAPVRLQLSRRKGFDLQALSQATNGLPAVNVARPGSFGNPFPVTKRQSLSAGITRPIWSVGTWSGPAIWFRDTPEDAASLSVDAFRAWLAKSDQASLVARAATDLRGKNLACWCRPGAPCHADALLELVNRPVCDEVAP